MNILEGCARDFFTFNTTEIIMDLWIPYFIPVNRLFLVLFISYCSYTTFCKFLLNSRLFLLLIFFSSKKKKKKIQGTAKIAHWALSLSQLLSYFSLFCRIQLLIFIDIIIVCKNLSLLKVLILRSKVLNFEALLAPRKLFN